jgi:hypothetical protein
MLTYSIWAIIYEFYSKTSAFTDEVERNCHFPAGTTTKEVYFVVFMERYLTRIKSL